MHVPNALSRLALAAVLLPALACANAARDAGADEVPAGTEAVSPFGVQPGVGARYGARDPRTCPSHKAPTRGAPSAAQAAQYVICNHEQVHNDYLYLAENVHVEVGRGRPYQVATDAFEEIDPGQPVYPIRGGLVSYQCNPLRTPRELASGFANNAGTNCTRDDEPHAAGSCYKSTFGDWTCSMVDKSVGVESRTRDVAPPR